MPPALSAGGSTWSRRALQVCIALGGLVPVGAGLSGALFGVAFLPGTEANVSADSHLRYLSGLLLAIGLAFWSTIPVIERRTAMCRLLTFVVFVGGLARLYGMVRMGLPARPMLFGLGMELVVTPLLCLWQARVAHDYGSPLR